MVTGTINWSGYEENYHMSFLWKMTAALLCCVLNVRLPVQPVCTFLPGSILTGNTDLHILGTVGDYFREGLDNAGEYAERILQSLDPQKPAEEQGNSSADGSAVSAGALDLGTFENLRDEFRYVKTIEDMELRGKNSTRQADVAVYEYVGTERPVKWAGYPYLYQLYDKDRKLRPTKALKTKRLYNNLLTEDRLIYFSPEEQCPYYKEVDAYYALRCAYDYYASHYHWFGPDGNSRTLVSVVTEVEELNGGESITETTAAETVDGDAYIFVGMKSGAEDDLELIMHEYTHLIMDGKGKNNTTEEGRAVEEGYADVMAVCAFSDDWNFGTNKIVRRLSGGRKTFYNKEDYDNNIISKVFSGFLDRSHSGATILGHAAYLMNEDLVIERLIPGRTVGEKLTKEQIALLFYRSIDYLNEDYDFDDAGKAILKAAYELNKEYGKPGNGMGNAGLSEEQIVRIREALESCGISSEWTPDLPWMDDPEKEEADPEPEMTETRFEVYGPELDDNYILQKKVQELVSEYGVLSTETLKGSENRTSNELSGILNVFIKDLDDDGAPELLLNRFDVTSGSLYFNMEIYEVFGENAVLQDKKRLQVPWLTEEMYKYSSSAGGFLFCRKNKGYYIAVETYEAFDGSVLTLAVYRYDGSRLCFENAGCFQETGEGSLSVRTADTEGTQVLNGADKESPEWETLCSYDLDSYEWNDINTIGRQTCIKAYAAIFTGPGIKIGSDIRLQGIPDGTDPQMSDYNDLENRRFMQDMKTTYAGTLDLTPLWQIASWNGPEGIQLVRTDHERHFTK